MRILTGAFLEALFPAPGFIELRAIRGEAVMRDFAAGRNEALAFFYKVKGTHDLFFGVASRAGCRSGGKRDLQHSSAVWVDIDAVDAIERLQDSGLAAPSILVSSGSPGHLHAYWLLERPFSLDAPEAVMVFESHLRGIAEACRGDGACVDASRVLRLPNSRNFKQAPPSYVDIVEWQPGRCFPLEAFPQGLLVEAGEVEPGDAIPPCREVETPWLKRILQQGYEGQHNPDHSEVDFKVACRLLEDGFAPGEVLWICLASPAIGHRKPHAEAYWRRTIGNALRRVA